MLIKCHFPKGKIIGFSFLKLNEDPVREMTIGHPPQREEKDPRTYHLPYDLKPSSPMLQGVLFLILFHFIFNFQTFTSTIFTKP